VRCRLRRLARPSHAGAPGPIRHADPMSALHCLAFLSVRNESNASSMIGSPIFGEGPLLARSGRSSTTRFLRLLTASALASDCIGRERRLAVPGRDAGGANELRRWVGPCGRTSREAGTSLQGKGSPLGRAIAPFAAHDRTVGLGYQIINEWRWRFTTLKVRPYGGDRNLGKHEGGAPQFVRSCATECMSCKARETSLKSVCLVRVRHV